MKVERNQLAEGTAWITPEGILFQGEYFSCRKALREGWYRRAEQGETWPVQVLFDPTVQQFEVIYIDSEEFAPDYLCYVLQRPVEPEYTAAYQERIRRLQEERKLLME